MHANGAAGADDEAQWMIVETGAERLIVCGRGWRRRRGRESLWCPRECGNRKRDVLSTERRDAPAGGRSDERGADDSASCVLRGVWCVDGFGRLR